MMPSNRIRAALSDGSIAYGTWAQMGSAEFCEIAALGGLEFVIVDMEHGSFGTETATNMIRAAQSCGASAMVRVPDATPSGIMKALDAGAAAILVPNVGSASMAEGVVAVARHAPHGARSACPCTRASGHGMIDWPDHVAWCDSDIQVGVLIETAGGVDHFDAIIAVPGIDFVAFGPFDLSQAMGYHGDWKHPMVQQKLAVLAKKALARGLEVMPSIFDTEPAALTAQIAHWRTLGARIFAVGGDRFVLSAGYRSIRTSLPR